MDVKSEKPDSYYEPPDPYKNAPSCHVNRKRPIRGCIEISGCCM